MSYAFVAEEFVPETREEFIEQLAYDIAEFIEGYAYYDMQDEGETFDDVYREAMHLIETGQAGEIQNWLLDFYEEGYPEAAAIFEGLEMVA